MRLISLLRSMNQENIIEDVYGPKPNYEIKVPRSQQDEEAIFLQFCNIVDKNEQLRKKLKDTLIMDENKTKNKSYLEDMITFQLISAAKKPNPTRRLVFLLKPW